MIGSEVKNDIKHTARKKDTPRIANFLLAAGRSDGKSSTKSLQYPFWTVAILAFGLFLIRQAVAIEKINLQILAIT